MQWWLNNEITSLFLIHLFSEHHTQPVPPPRSGILPDEINLGYLILTLSCPSKILLLANLLHLSLPNPILPQRERKPFNGIEKRAAEMQFSLLLSLSLSLSRAVHTSVSMTCINASLLKLANCLGECCIQKLVESSYPEEIHEVLEKIINLQTGNH